MLRPDLEPEQSGEEEGPPRVVDEPADLLGQHGDEALVAALLAVLLLEDDCRRRGGKARRRAARRGSPLRAWGPGEGGWGGVGGGGMRKKGVSVGVCKEGGGDSAGWDLLASVSGWESMVARILFLCGRRRVGPGTGHKQNAEPFFYWAVAEAGN
jgi:hypothetical protein